MLCSTVVIPGCGTSESHSTPRSSTHHLQYMSNPNPSSYPNQFNVSAVLFRATTSMDTHTLGYASHVHLPRLQQQTLPGRPRWQVVVLVRPARRSTLCFNPGKGFFCFLGSRNIEVVRVVRCTVDNLTCMEDPRPNHETTFNATTFDESKRVVQAWTGRENLDDYYERPQLTTYLCIVVTPYARKVSISQEVAGYLTSVPDQ